MTTAPAATEAVLMLSTYSTDNIPMVIGYNGLHNFVSLIFLLFKNNLIILGEVDDDINFTYDADTSVAYSCAASLNDEMWVLGGSGQSRQVNETF